MRTPFFLFCVVAAAVAQDVEPNLGRAVIATAREIARDAPWKAPEAKSLTIVAENRASVAAATSLRERLLAEGFRITSDERDSTSLRTTVGVRAAGGQRILKVCLETEPEPFVVERGYGDADWADARDAHRTVVAGPDCATPEEARTAARAELIRVRSEKYPTLASSKRRRAALYDDPSAEFVSVAGAGSDRLYRAYLRSSSETELAAMDERCIRDARRAPWFKGVGTAATAGFLLIVFKLLDWITRGWRTRTLRFVFGSLFAAAVLGLWGVLP